MNLNRLGIGASVLCGIHCAALPLIAGASWFAGLESLHSPWVEGTLLGAAALIGAGTLSAGFRRHGNARPLLLLVFGLAVLLSKHQVLPQSWETSAALVGAVFLVGAQWLNRRCPAACCAGAACAGDSGGLPLEA